MSRFIKPSLIIALLVCPILMLIIDIFNIKILLSTAILFGIFLIGLEKRFSNNQIQFLFGFILCMDIGVALCPDMNPLVRYCENYYQFNLIDFFVAYYLARIIATSSNAYTNKKTSIILPCAFLTLVLISAAQSTNLNATLFYALYLVKLYIVYLYYSLFFDKDTIASSFIKGIAFGILFEFLICFAQFVHGGPLGLTFLGEGSGFRGRYVNGSLTRSVSGTFLHTSALAVYTLFAFSFIWFSKGRMSKRLKYCSAAACVIITLMTQSRTAMAIYVVLIVYFFINYIRSGLTRKKAIYLFLGLIVSILGCTFVFVKYSDIFLHSDFGQMYSTRAYHWLFGYKYIQENILSGYGANNWSDVMQKLYGGNFLTSESWFFYQNPIHNVFLQMWFDLGVLGALVYALLYLRVIYGIFRKKCYSELTVVCAAFVICAAIVGMFDWSMLTTKMQLCFWIVLGIYQNQINLIGKDNYEIS